MYSSFVKTFFYILIILILVDCSCSHDGGSLTQAQYDMVKNNVQKMTESIAKNISDKGPVSWLSYFENSPDFFMASDGQLKFPNNDSATVFINNTLIKIIPKIELHWKTIRIDPLTTKLASIGSYYHEDITNNNGLTLHVDGYFTGIAHLTSQGWKLRNAHWSRACSEN